MAYLVFKLVVDFILPVYRTTQQVKQKFREMNQHTGGGGRSAKPSANTQQKDNTGTKKSPLGEYIDFEEVKDK